MARLGLPLKITYEAVNFRSGLTGITATVLRPDGVKLGPIALTEIAHGEFSGIYQGVVGTSLGDPEGDWVYTVIEGTRRSTVKVNMTLSEGGGGIDLSSGQESKKVVGLIKSNFVSGTCKASQLFGTIGTQILRGVVLNTEQTIIGKVGAQALKGVASCKS